ncbi:O-antigen ligase family protein [Acinetobacter sp. GSS19]|uniref:O-antigen ligase family protein n=1 Tax=Acinetobacter sp. GSS19 TaxID=3020716 RepID=UPI0023630E68|nr:O-antigen ligase family protein [Acinetobacter sp. GSS19]
MFYFLIIIYLVLGILGYQIGWAVYQYDELRLLQFPIALLALITIFFRKIVLSWETQLTFYLIGLVIFFNCLRYGIFQLQELCSVLILLFILVALITDQYYKKYFYHASAVLIFSATLPCLFIFPSLFYFITEQKWLDWQFNSGSIRIYDSVIVPLFFLLILLKNKNYPYSKFFFPAVVFLFTLVWLFDGARSALLSVILGLIVLFLFSKAERGLVFSTFLYMFLAFALYKGIFVLFTEFNTVSLVNTVELTDKKIGESQNPIVARNLEILRTGSSLRAEMWLFMFEQWKQDPFWGVGGGYLAKIGYPYGHHIHNFYLRMIFEWGVIGLIFLLWAFYKVVLLFKDKSVNIILKTGLIALLVDAIFSGNMVYPLSQISCILFISFIFSQRYLNKEKIIFNAELWTSKLFFIVWGSIFIYITLIYFYQDLTCWGCISSGGRMAPNFWEFGAAGHLTYSNQAN